MSKTSSQEVDVEVFDDLLEKALAHRSGEVIVVPTEQREEYEWIVHIIEVIDANWTTTSNHRSRIFAAFANRMKEEFNEDWDHLRPVATLGDLVDVRGSELPALAHDTLLQLKADATPIEQLKDPEDRTRAVGKAMRRAGVPKTLISEFISWVIRVLDETRGRPGEPHLYVVPCPS